MLCSDVVVGQGMKKNSFFLMILFHHSLLLRIKFIQKYRIRSLLTAVEFRSASRNDFMMKVDMESFVFRSQIV